MKSNYDGFRGWLNYIRDYKDNKDLLGENTLEKELREEIEKLKANSKEKDNLLVLRNKRIDSCNEEIIDLKRRNDEIRRNMQEMGKETKKLQEKLQEKEKARRKNAGAIGGLKAENNKLKQDLERANQKITWLKTNQKAPTKEEIIAYETRQREVEKRQHEKRSK